MDPQTPWDSAQIKQAAEDLAILAVADRLLGEKQAEGFADALRGFANTARDYVGDAWQNLPQKAKNPLLYAGVGAAGGGLLGGLSSLGRDPEERRPFRSALSGALAGAAGGAGLGLLRDQLPNEMEDLFGMGRSPAKLGPPPHFDPSNPTDLSQLPDEALTDASHALQRLTDPTKTPAGQQAAMAGGALAGGLGGVHAADMRHLGQQGLGPKSTLLERGAAGIDVDKVYKGRTDDMPDIVRRLQQPGGLAPDIQRDLMQEAHSRQPVGPAQKASPRTWSAFSPGGPPPLSPEFMHQPTEHPVMSKILKDVETNEIRKLMSQGRQNSRAGLRARGIGGGLGGGLGGVAGGLLGNLGYNYFFGNE